MSPRSQRWKNRAQALQQAEKAMLDALTVFNSQPNPITANRVRVFISATSAQLAGLRAEIDHVVDLQRTNPAYLRLP